jgi:hypothetical protein
MLKILGCDSFEKECPKTDGNRIKIVEESSTRVKHQLVRGSPAQDASDVKESDTWIEYNRKHGYVGRRDVQIDGIRDLSVTNVDRLPESVDEMFHPKKKRVSDISIFKAEEFNAGDPFAQMKSDEVDEFYGEDDAP